MGNRNSNLKNKKTQIVVEPVKYLEQPEPIK